MFIEFEIKEEDRIYRGLFNIHHIISLQIEDSCEVLIISLTDDTIRFFDGEGFCLVLLNAFKRALRGESIILDGIGYIRPLKPMEGYTGPNNTTTKPMTWRNFP